MSDKNNIILSNIDELLNLMNGNKEAPFFINLEQNNKLIAIHSCGITIKNQKPHILLNVAIQTILPKEIISELKNKAQKNQIPYSAFRDANDNIANFLKREVRLNLMNENLKSPTYKISFPTKK